MPSGSNPLVSVCIPVKNGELHIQDAIESVLEQTYETFELIVLDNASEDRTVEIVRSNVDPRLRLVESKAAVGAIENWIRTCRLAQGEYLKLLCHDDFIDARQLAIQVKALEDNPTATISSTKRRLIDEDGHVLMDSFGLGKMAGLVPGKKAIEECIAAGTNLLGEPAAVLFRRSAIEKAGVWSDAFPYLVDLEMYFRVLAQGDLFAIQAPLAAFRTHRASWSSRVRSSQGPQARALIRAWSSNGSGVSKRARVEGQVRASLLPYARSAAGTRSGRSLLMKLNGRHGRPS